MKKIICMLLSFMLLLSLAACGNREEAETTIPETTQQTTQETTAETTESEGPAESVTGFYMDMKHPTDEEPAYLLASVNEDGSASIEYKTSSGRKIADMDAVVLEQLAKAYRLSILSQLNGQEIYDEGSASCCASISIGEEICSYTYYGENVPEEFATVFADMEALFVQMLQDVPEYVPTMQVLEDVDKGHLATVTEIMENSGYAALDSITVMNVPADENFGYMAGLSTSEGIEVCTSMTHMMMTTPYSLVVVTLAEGTEAATVVADFKTSIDWGKWVCVNPSSAIIATRDNMVLCLIGLDELYTGTAAGVEATGWTVVETLTNPNL